jgi:superfamily II RNA helicase
VPLVYHSFHKGRLAPLFRRAGSSSRSLLAGTAARNTRPWELRTDAEEVVMALRDREMLPAIYFHFSRRGCEEAMQRCGSLELLTDDEAAAIEAEVTRATEGSPELRHHPHLRFLRLGLAAHHAGLLPRWKGLVERLFQRGLVKVVFATETLAAGINMPARSTVISGLTKRAERAYRVLTPSEFTQMAGRAGRRGMDRTGHVVVVDDPFRPAAEAAQLAAAAPDALLSRFTPGYSLVLNLLRHHTPAEAEQFLHHSFGQFLADARRAPGAGAPALYRGSFQHLIAVLTERGYLRDHRPTPAGRLAAAFRAENELLVAEIARSGLLDDLPPAGLAAVLMALSAEGDSARCATGCRVPGAGCRARTAGTRHPAPGTLDDRSAAALAEARVLATGLRETQRRHHVDVPCRLVEGPCGLAHLWAGGAVWEEIIEVTDLDEGDIVYLLRSLIDLLGQLREAPGVAPGLQERAGQAIAAIDRDPVDAVL